MNMNHLSINKYLPVYNALSSVEVIFLSYIFFTFLATISGITYDYLSNLLNYPSRI